MNLTDPEKLILMMLSDIHKHLKIKNGADSDFVQSAILTGNTWGLYWKFPGIFEGRGETPAAVSEVLDILEMWETVESSYDRLSPEDKAEIDKHYKHSVRFRGFDGNNETEHMGIAQFLVDELDRFTCFKGRDFNSHLPQSLHRYRRMLPVYKQYTSEPTSALGLPQLTASQLIDLLEARLGARTLEISG